MAVIALIYVGYPWGELFDMPNLDISDAVAHPLMRYRNHLEFHGYRIEEGDDVIVCRHLRKPNLMMRHIPDRGVLISTMYSFKSGASRLRLLEYVNELNAEFLFMKAFLDEDQDLVMETFLEGDYDRTNLSILLDNLEYDMETLFRMEHQRDFLS